MAKAWNQEQSRSNLLKSLCMHTYQQFMSLKLSGGAELDAQYQGVIPYFDRLVRLPADTTSVSVDEGDNVGRRKQKPR